MPGTKAQKKQMAKAKKNVKPKKVWVEKGKQLQAEKEKQVGENLDKARVIAQLEGARGIDPRTSGLTPANALGNMAMPQLDHSVDVVGFVQVDAVATLALGPVLSAIKRGWLSQRTISGAQGGTVAYNAWVYLTQSFLNCSQGIFPTIQSAPEWFWQVCDAIRPKVVPFKTADVSYKVSLLGGGVDYVPPSVYDYGGGPSQIVFGTPDTSNLVNGMPIVAPASYNASVAQDSIQSLFDYFPESLMCSRGPSAKVPYMQKDTSAFAGVYSEWGFSKGGTGGLATSLTSEAHIDSPIVAKLCQYSDSRGYADIRRSSGSPCYVIPRVMEFTEYKQFHNKAAPIFKFYNFDRYFQILSLAVARALEIGNTSNVGVFPIKCPLTSQQVQILLRQAILPIFSNEMAQDLTADDSITMTPFSTACNGYASPGSDMLLPSFLTETIRAASRKVVQVAKRYSNYQLDFIPILARSPDIGQLANYQYNGNPVYEEVLGEIPVNLIDMSALLPSIGKVYALPACSTVDSWRQDWNQFVHKIESALAGVSPIGTEKGISCLSNIFFTDFTTPVAAGNDANVIPVQGRPKVAKQVSKRNVKEWGLPAKTKVKNTPTPLPGSEFYESVGLISTSTSIAENGVEWKYQRVMPHAYCQSPPAGSGDYFVSKRQVFNHEGFKVTHSTAGIDDTGSPFDNSLWTTSVYNMDLAASSYCVRGQLSAESEVEIDLRALSEQGRGGFLTSIAGMLGEDVFGIKGSKKFLAQVGEMTGL